MEAPRDGEAQAANVPQLPQAGWEPAAAAAGAVLCDLPAESGVTKVLKGRFIHSAFKPQLKIQF